MNTAVQCRPVFFGVASCDVRIDISGPGGRRFKFSLPDHSFHADKRCLWLSVDSDGVEIVDGVCIVDLQTGFPREFQSDFPQHSQLCLLSKTVHERSNGFS
jgi:hypothetical protein